MKRAGLCTLLTWSVVMCSAPGCASAQATAPAPRVKTTSTQYSGSHANDFCGPKRIPLLSRASLAVRFQPHIEFQSSDHGTSLGVLISVERPVKSLRLEVALLNKADEPMLVVEAMRFSTIEAAAKLSASPHSNAAVGVDVRAMDPGAPFAVFAKSLLALRSCPKTASIQFLELEFLDGTTQSYRNDTAHPISPVFMHLDAVKLALQDRMQEGTEVVLVKVGADGNVRANQCNESQSLACRLLPRLVVKDDSAGAEVAIVVRTHQSAGCQHRVESKTSVPMLFVDVYPGDAPVVFLAGMPVAE